MNCAREKPVRVQFADFLFRMESTLPICRIRFDNRWHRLLDYASAGKSAEIKRNDRRAGNDKRYTAERFHKGFSDDAG